MTPSISTCKEVPWSRRASAPACAEASMDRLRSASADASHAAVAGMSDLIAAMQSDYTAGEVVISHLGEAGGAQHLEQRFLIGMHAYGLRQIPIAGFVARHEPAEQRQHLERIGVVNRFESRRRGRRKFQHQQLAAAFQHAMHGFERGGLVGHVAQPKAYGDAIEGVVLEWQVFSVGDEALHIPREALVEQPVPAALEPP